MELQNSPSKQRSILLVDDHDINRKILKVLLGKTAFDYQVVASGQEALDALTKRKFDVVLMDIQMPEMDGLETTKRIRASGAEYSTIPVVAMTANAIKGDRERFMSVGMNDYLSKPFKEQDLISLIDRWC